ncbi:MULTISPECIES: winged helix-turn-helix transcriptional regulator [Streptomyces]|uniref:Response regulator transcription factor n=1 Tax=Streptomyces xanthii TaxID=2768069 RepID=A0A7H1BC13_9ACTN|nr:response regulator transcription factor [Streptomyces xanthii]QNS06268.1 response regulator transcription factor [Streptomyces xanthii]
MTATGRALPLLLVATPADAPPHVLTTLRDPRFTYRMVHTGQDALRDLYRYRPDLLLLSLRLRDPGPWDVLQRVREMTEDLRVMALDRTYRERTALRALEAGADDLLWLDVPLPFAKALILARLRRAMPADPAAQLLDDGVLRLDLLTREASLSGTFVPLTALEFDLLFALAFNAGQVLTPEQLLARAWRSRPGGDPTKVKHAVLRLRRSITHATGQDAPVETVRGVGYRYVPPRPARS